MRSHVILISHPAVATSIRKHGVGRLVVGSRSQWYDADHFRPLSETVWCFDYRLFQRCRSRLIRFFQFRSNDWGKASVLRQFVKLQKPGIISCKEIVGVNKCVWASVTSVGRSYSEAKQKSPSAIETRDFRDLSEDEFLVGVRICSCIDCRTIE